MAGNFSPKVALVTGGAQGIGYSVVHRLADDGLDIAVNDIVSKSDKINEVVEEIRKKGRKAIAIPGDVSKEADVQAMVEKAVQELGRLDVVSTLVTHDTWAFIHICLKMVANAGVGPGAPFLESKRFSVRISELL